MIYFAVLFVLFTLMFRFIPQLRIEGLNPWSQSIGYGVKIAAGFSFLYIYTKFYGNGALSADAGAFMKESLILNNVFWESPLDYFKLIIGWDSNDHLMYQYLSETNHWDPGAQAILSDNRNILRVHSLIHFFSRNMVSIHVLVMSVISLIGIKQFYLAAKDHSEIPPKYLYAILLLFPSVLFWTSSILKEPLMFLGLGLFARGIMQISLSRKKKIGLVSGGTLLLLAFKPYILFCILPAVLFYFIYILIPKWKVLISFAVLLIIGVIGAFALPNQRNKFVHTLSWKQYDFKNVGKGGIHALGDSCFYYFDQDQLSELIIEGDSVSIDKEITAKVIYPGSIDDPTPIRLYPTGQKWYIYFENDRSDGFIETTKINDSFIRLIKNIPEALFNSLLRPHIGDPGSWLKYPAMIEVLVLFLFLGYTLFYRRQLNEREVGIVWSLLLFAILLALMIGWVTPVLGAIVRYRIPSFIALLYIGLMLYRNRSKSLQQ